MLHCCLSSYFVVLMHVYVCMLGVSETAVLLQFVDEKVQWMHIDMAGPVWNEKKRSATGFGIATLVEWVLKNASQK